MKTKEILYLTYDGLTDPLGQSQVLPYIIGLSKYNYKFSIISFEKKARFIKNKAIINAICRENNLIWMPLFYTKRPPVFSTVWDIIKLNKLSKKLHKEKKFELIHCRSYITSLIGLGFKKKYGTKFIFDMRGFWADERVDGLLWNIKNPLYRWVYNFFKSKEKDFLVFSDIIISLTENGKTEILSWQIPNLTKRKITVIPCAADYSLFDINTPKKKEDAKKQIGLNNSNFVLSYIGSLGTWYMAEEMILFFSILKQKIIDAKFLLLTPDKIDILLPIINKYELNINDFIIKFSSREKLPSFAHASDVSIFFIKPVYSKKSSSPTKLGELLAMGIPVICNNGIGDVNKIVKNKLNGICINECNIKSFNNVLEEIDSIHKLNANKIREESKNYYELNNNVSKYYLEYKKILEND
mgnify:CR=1 FL=1